jgi:hypothetical protein
MSAPTLYEVATAIAAVVSATGGAFAAIAAFRSASSAQNSARSAEQAERRASLREVSGVAASIQAAVLGVSSRGAELLLEYQSAEVFSGSTDHSSLRQLRQSTEVLVEKARSFAPDAQLFSGGASSLAESSSEDIERVRIRLSENLELLHVIRDELDRKYIAMAAQNDQRRQVLLQSKAKL